MILGLGGRGGLWGGAMAGSCGGITYDSPAKMGQNGGPPKFTGFPGSQLGCSSFGGL